MKSKIKMLYRILIKMINSILLICTVYTLTSIMIPTQKYLLKIHNSVPEIIIIKIGIVLLYTLLVILLIKYSTKIDEQIDFWIK